jgi:hypothetical protein
LLRYASPLDVAPASLPLNEPVEDAEPPVPGSWNPASPGVHGGVLGAKVNPENETTVGVTFASTIPAEFLYCQSTVSKTGIEVVRLVQLFMGDEIVATILPFSFPPAGRFVAVVVQGLSLTKIDTDSGEVPVAERGGLKVMVETEVLIPEVPGVPHVAVPFAVTVGTANALCTPTTDTTPVSMTTTVAPAINLLRSTLPPPNVADRRSASASAPSSLLHCLFNRTKKKLG